MGYLGQCNFLKQLNGHISNVEFTIQFPNADIILEGVEKIKLFNPIFWDSRIGFILLFKSNWTVCLINLFRKGLISIKKKTLKLTELPSK